MNENLKEPAVTLIIFGAALVITGTVIFFSDKLPFHPGRLPGDINIRGENSSFHFPLGTCIVISIILTAIANIVMAIFKK